MSTQAEVPMIAPDGSVGDIPQERVPEAIRAGGKLGTDMLGPDGSRGVIPIDRVHEAINAGGRLAPPGVPVPPNPLAKVL